MDLRGTSRAYAPACLSCPHSIGILLSSMVHNQIRKLLSGAKALALGTCVYHLQPVLLQLENSRYPSGPSTVIQK